MLFTLPHRKFVFTIPKALRVFLRYDQRLFAEISRLIFSLIAGFYSTASGKPITTGAVIGFQTFGEFGVWHLTAPATWAEKSHGLTQRSQIYSIGFLGSELILPIDDYQRVVLHNWP